MFTQCPHCDTLFRVHAEQLRAAHGRVRCCLCRGAFDALEYLREVPAEEVTPDAPETVSARDDATPYPPPSQQPAESAAQTEDELLFQAPEDLEEAPAEDSGADAPAIVRAQQSRPAPAAQQRGPEWTDDESPFEDHGKLGQARDELPFEVPENLPDIKAAKTDAEGLPLDSRPTAPQRFFWNLGVFALTGLLLLQVAWINRESLAGFPQGYLLLEKFCGLIRCTTPIRKAPDQIRILEREMRPLPDAGNARQVRLVIANDAPFPQPYPLLQIELFTDDARLFAQRHFTPGEYLPADVESDSLMTPGQPTQVVLDLVDPGQSVTGYRFGFSAP